MMLAGDEEGLTRDARKSQASVGGGVAARSSGPKRSPAQDGFLEGTRDSSLKLCGYMEFPPRDHFPLSVELDAG